jgi:hypothetical protein
MHRVSDAGSGGLCRSKSRVSWQRVQHREVPRSDYCTRSRGRWDRIWEILALLLLRPVLHFHFPVLGVFVQRETFPRIDAASVWRCGRPANLLCSGTISVLIVYGNDIIVEPWAVLLTVSLGAIRASRRPSGGSLRLHRAV